MTTWHTPVSAVAFISASYEAEELNACAASGLVLGQCEAVTMRGARCKNKAVEMSLHRDGMVHDKCGRHLGDAFSPYMKPKKRAR